MKKQFLKLSLIVLVLSSLSIVLSSFVADSENEAKYYVATGGGCTYTCWVQLNDGTWTHYDVAGTYTDCERSEVSSTCISHDCAPIVSCKK